MLGSFVVNRESTTSTLNMSVVVVILGGRSYLPKCLEALVQQVSGEDAEIVVPTDRRTPDLAALQKLFPAVRFLAVSGRRTYAELRALGVQESRGTIVALTEDHCTPNSDWCAQIRKAHAGSHVAVGGAVDKKGSDTAINWALYLADYGRYMSPMPEGPLHHLSDCNVSYKRSALQTISDVWHREFHEPAVHEALRARGESLWFSPRVVVRQQRSLGFSEAVKDRYSFGRLFGGERVASASRLVRLFYVSFSMLLPVLLTARVAQQVFRRRRRMGVFLYALPALALLNLAWAWGEFVGYVTGRAGDSLTPKIPEDDPRLRKSAAT
jgi:hypothetical protein